MADIEDIEAYLEAQVEVTNTSPPCPIFSFDLMMMWLLLLRFHMHS